MHTTKRLFITFSLVILLALIFVGVVAAAPAASVTLGGAGDVFIGTSPINLSVTFDNTAAAGAANIGYGPFIDVYFPVNGADGAANTSLPLDGVDYLPGTATYLGLAVTETILTFPDTPPGLAPCGPTQTQVTHPYAVDITHTAIVVCGTPGDKLVVFQLPFGSFTPEQPAATIDFQASLSNFADLNVPLDLFARGGFQYGADPLDNPCCDPSFFSDGSPSTMTDNPVGAVNPILMTLSKVDSPPEGEVATGPNHPHTYTVSVEVAPGQTVTNLDIFDYIDDNIVVTAISAPGASSVTLGGIAPAFPVGPVLADGTANRLIVTYPSASGTVSFTISYFVPLLDASGASIITPNNGAASVTENRANAVGDWDPLDPRDVAGTNNATAGDGTCPACPPLTSHTNEPLPVQKSASNSDANPSPGDIVTYTFTVQVSDFFAMDNVQIFDVISDGQRIISNPSIAYTQHGVSFSNAVNPANFEIREYFTGGTPGVGGLPDVDAPSATAGDTVLAIDLSAEILAELGLTEILGGCVPVGGTGGGNPNCSVFNGGATSITLTYQTQIQDAFTDSHLEVGNSSDASVDHGDTLDNVVSIEADDVLSTTNLASTGSPSAVVNGSGTSLTIAQGLTEKSIFAIYDPLTPSFLSIAGTPQVSPGNVVTFRLRYEMPSTDYEDFSLSDYLPLPVLDANEVTTFVDTVSDGTNTLGSGVPVAGQAMWGPTGVTDGNVNFRSRISGIPQNLQNGGTTPDITVPGFSVPALCGGTAIDPNENYVNFCFGDFDDPNNVDSFIDILFSVTISDDPYADGLFLTNFVRGGTGSTNAADANSDEIVMFELREPILLVRKGITDTDGASENFDSQAEPTGTNMEDVGSPASPPWGGIDPSNIGTGGDANVSGPDAGDTIRYMITIQNTGGSAAYDITLYDVLPAGLPASSVQNFGIHLGDGTSLGFTRPNGSPATVADFFNPAIGIRINDPSEGACQSYDINPALGIIIITYDLTIDNTVAAGDILTNTTTITDYAGTEGGPTHLSDPANRPEDSASVEIVGELLKEIVSTSEGASSDAETGTLGDERPVLIGEVVRYSLTFNVPEGTSTDVAITDNLPAGMQYIGGASFAYNSWSGVEPTDPVISGGAGVGDAVTFTYGTITNPDNDLDVESVTIEFDAIVSNIAANQDGVFLTNNADYAVNGNIVTSSDDVILEIIEPNLSMDKTISFTYEGSGLILTPPNDAADAGDEFTYRVEVTNNGNAPAYDVQLIDFIPITYLEQFGIVITTGGGSPCCFSYNSGTGEWNLSWGQINPGQTVAAHLRVRVRDTVAGLDTWTNTADITYNSLPDTDGSGNNVPGAPGDDNGLRNGDDGIGGAVDDYAATATSPAITVPEPSVAKQIEHPSQVPVATGFFGGAYGDSTSDPNTGESQHTANQVDLTIGETFNYIITFTLPEGTTYDFTMIDLVSPNGHTGGLENRVIDMISAEVIWIGGNLSGSGVEPVGTFFTIEDSTPADGDGTRSQLYAGGNRDILNTPDGVVNDDDRYIIRITARIDDEDASGGAADDVAAPVSNSNGNVSGNRLQTQWRDSNNVQITRNIVTRNDIVEPNVSVSKTTITGTNLESGDTAVFDLVVANTLTAPAYNIEITDTLPFAGITSFLSFDSVDAANSTCDDLTGFAVATAGNDVIFTWDELLVGASCTIRFNATVTDGITPNETYTNSVSVTSFDSLPDNTQADNRNYVGNTATSTINTASPTITKGYLDTSEDHTDPGDTRSGIDNANEVPLVIGEIIRYELRVQLIEGTHTNLIVEDLVPSGLEIVYDSQYTVTLPTGVTSTNPDLAGISGVGGTISLYNDAGALLAANTDLGAGNAISLFFGAATINTDADSSTTEEIIIRFNAYVLNSTAASNDRGDQRDNFASYSEGAGTAFGISNTVHAVIREPLLTITKDASPLVGDAGDTITFTLTVTNDNNANGATAFDINVIDVLPAQYTNLVVTNPGGGTDNSVGNTLSIYIPSLAQNSSVTIEYTADLVIGVVPAQVITNTADVTWTSLPGDFGTNDGAGGNNTGSDLSELNTNQGGHTSGSDDGERNGNASNQNDYFDDDTADVTIVQIAPEKSIIATSETHTTDASLPNNGSSDVPVAIGEVVTFQLVLTIPEGTSDDVIMSDVLVAGIEYIAGSTRLYTNSANNMIFAGLGAVSNNPLAPDVLAEDGDGAPTNVGTVRYDAGTRTVEVNLGDILNQDNDVDGEQVVVLFDVVVLNDAASNLGTIWTNEFDASVAGNTPVTSNQVSVIVQEPQVTITKGINAGLSTPATTGPFDTGDIVVYDVVVSNPAGANISDAFDLLVTDNLVSELSLDSISYTGVITGTTDDSTSVYGAAGTASVTISQLAPGESLTIHIYTTVLSNVTDAQIITNQSDLTWTSLPGNQGTGNATPGNSGDSDGERDGSGGTNDYTDSDTDNFTVGATYDAVKTIEATSEDHTDAGETLLPNDGDLSGAPDVPVVIGEVVTYRLATQLAEGTMVNLNLTDQLSMIGANPLVTPIFDDNFTVTIINAQGGTINFTNAGYAGLNAANGGTVALFDAGGTPQFAGLVNFNAGTNFLRLNFEELVNSDGDANIEYLIVDFNVVVMNNADTNLGDIIANTFQIFSDDFNGNPTLRDSSNTVNLVIEEPTVDITKSINTTLSNPSGTTTFDGGDTVVYDIVVTGVDTTSFNLNIVDGVDVNLDLTTVQFIGLPGYATTSDSSNNGVPPEFVDVTISELRPGDFVTIQVTATVRSSVTIAQIIANQASVTWTSLPGIGTTANPTGSDTPGGSGASNGERNGEIPAVIINDYTNSSNVDFTVTGTVDTIKSIDGTSEIYTDDSTADDALDPRPVAIGEVMTYRLVVEVPEGTSPDVQVTDILSTNIEYLAGTARISYFANNPMDFNTAPLDTAGILNELNPTTLVDASIISFGVTGPRELNFDIGAVVNNDADNATSTELIVIEFDVVVVDTGTTIGDIWANNFSVDLNNDATDDDTSNDVYSLVVEPVLNMTKTFTPDEQVRDGTTTLVLVVTNFASDGATAPVFDLEITDLLDDWLNVESIVIDDSNAPLANPVDLSDFSSGFGDGLTDDLRVSLDRLNVDDFVTITVTLRIASDPFILPIDLPRTITNNATVIGDTLDADDGFGGSDATEDREYLVTATDDLNVVKPTLLVTKTDSVDPVAAGALMSYTVSIQNTGTPNFDATNVVFTDQLPAGFIVTLVNPSQGTCSPIAGGILTCNLGTIASGAAANVVITGRYPATTPAGTITNNIAYIFSSTEGNDGNDGDDTPADNDDERAEEQSTVLRQVDVAITKVVDDASPNEGDLITFTLNVTNNGPSQATNVIVTDTLPAGLTFVGLGFVPVSLPCTTAGQTLTCTFPTLNVGQTRTIGIEATVDTNTSGTSILNTADVTTTEPESNIANNTSNATVTVDGIDLQVVKTVDNSTPNEGDTINYTITVTNLGPAPATGIEVTDDLNGVAGISYVSDNSAATVTTYDNGTGIWTLTGITLDAGDSLSLVITATVDAGASALVPQPDNIATISASDQVDSNSANDTDNALIAVGGLDLAITKGVNIANPIEGQTIVYSIVLQNLGAANATEIFVLDQLDGLPVTYVSHVANRPGTTYTIGTGEWYIPSLLAGRSIRLDITVTVNAGTAGSPPIVNIASIDDVDQTDSNPANDTDDATITVAGLDIAVVKTVDNATPAEGDTVVWSITAINNGPGNATDLNINDILPAGVSYVTDNTVGGTLLNSAGLPTTYAADVWTIGTLNSGQSLTLQITTTVDIGATGTISNTASLDTVNLDQPDSNAGNNTDDAIIAISGLDLQVTKTVDTPTANENDPIVYSITVENLGPANATNIEITDDFVALGLPVTLGAVTAPNDSAGNPTSYVGGVWTIGELLAGQSLTLQLPATVNAGTSGTPPIVNTAVLTAVDQADSNPLNNEDDATVTVGGVDIAVTKVVNNPAPALGETVTYTITVTNLGTGTATNIVLNESLPIDNVNLTYVTHNASVGNFTPSLPSSTWTIPLLAGGISATLTIDAIVEIDTGQILNVASLTSLDQPDTDPSNDSDDATITLNGVDLSVVKTVNNPTPNTGDNVIYTIVASNNSPSINATNVIVEDILPAGVSYVIDNSATLFDGLGVATDYDEISGNWLIGQLNAGSSLALTIEVTVNVNGGQVVNTAEITGNEPESDSSNNIDDATISVDSADLSLTKSISTTTPLVGDIITYTVTVSNAGPNIAYNVEVSDYLPSTVSFVSATVSQGTVDTITPGLPTVVWTVGTIPVNGAATLQINAEVVSSFGTFVNVAEVTASDQSDPDSTPDNGVPNEDDYAESGFLFDPPFGRKVFDASGLPELEWTVIWVNPNTDPLAVSVSDPLIAGTSFVAGSLTCTSPGTLVVNNCSFDVVSRSVVFSGTIFPDPGLTPAQINSAVNPLIITYRVVVDDSLREVRNEAFLNSVNGDNVSAQATWRRDDVPAPTTGGTAAAITLTKYVEPAIAFPGETLTWILEVSNPSGANATGVVVNDTIPLGLNIQTTLADAGTVTVNGQDVTWSIGTVAAGQTLRLRITTQVSPDLDAPVTNTAIVFGDNFQAQEASATAAFVGALPNTGEVAWWTVWLFWAGLLAIPALLVGAWWTLRRMRQNY